MTGGEPRERRREAVRRRMIQAAADLLSEGGTDAVSLRNVADRADYSAAAVYLYFRDKDELLGEIVREGFARLDASFRDELRQLSADADPKRGLDGLRRAYLRFAVENTAYFRLMFQLPGAPKVEHPGAGPGGEVLIEKPVWMRVRSLASAAGFPYVPGAPYDRMALGAWAMVHGLASLYVAGHLTGMVEEVVELDRLAEELSAIYERGLRSGADPPPPDR